MIYKIVIFGVFGYIGVEFIWIIVIYFSMEIVVFVVNFKVGKFMVEVFLYLCYLELLDLIKIDEIDFDNVDLVFCGLFYVISQKVIKVLLSNVKVVDLLVDFWLCDFEEYVKWYGGQYDVVEL